MLQLTEKGNFLSLSRTHPSLFSSPSSFSLENGTHVTVTAPGIISFHPQTLPERKKFIVLSCGVHGNETAPIEICDDMVQQILTGTLVLSHPVLFLFGNLPAMDIGERFVEENMNRLFSGAHSAGEGCVNDERKRAKALEEAVSHFYSSALNTDTKYHYDLHTAIRASKNEKFAVYPYLHERKHSLSLGSISAGEPSRRPPPLPSSDPSLQALPFYYKAIEAGAAALRNEYPGRKVQLLAHSIGGWISRAYLGQLPAEERSAK